MSTANTIQYEWQWKVLWEHREWRDSFSQRELVKKFSRQGRDILGEAHGVCKGPLSWSCTAFMRNHQESITACKRWASKAQRDVAGKEGQNLISKHYVHVIIRGCHGQSWILEIHKHPPPLQGAALMGFLCLILQTCLIPGAPRLSQSSPHR